MATLAHNTRPCRVGAVPVLLAYGARLLRVVALLTVLLGTAGESAYGRAAAAPDDRFIASAPLVDATLRFDQNSYEVLINSTFAVDLVVDNADSLAGWEAKLGFDPAQLEVIQVTAGNFLSRSGRTVASLQLASGADQLIIGGYTYGTQEQSPVSGSGVLAHLTLRALAAGQTPITLEDAILARVAGSEVQSMHVSVPASEVNVTVPLAVAVATFQATAQRDGIQVAWESASEIDNLGFNLYRSAEPAAPQGFLTFVPAQAPGSSQGFAYDWLDSDVAAGQTYHYWLEAVDLMGSSARYGPVSATFQTPTVVSMAGAQAGAGGQAAVAWWFLAGGVALLVTIGWLMRKR